MATRDPHDDPALIPFLVALRHPKLLGEDVSLRVMSTDDKDTPTVLAVDFSGARSAEIAVGDQRSLIEKKFNELCPAGNDQRWLFEFHLDRNHAEITRTTFERVIAHRLINQPVCKSTDEAAAHYPELILPRGIDDRGKLISWEIGRQGQVDALICGAQGSGKSASIATLITEAAAGGCAIVLIDFKHSDSFERFADIPNMHLHTREFNDNLRAISYVEHVLACRNDGTRPPIGAPPKGTPILALIDEAPTFFKEAPEELVRSVIAIQEKGRSERVHLVLAAQNITARTVPTDSLRLCSYREQWGYKDISESLLLWGNANVEIGSSVPVGVPGRGVVTGDDGRPVLLQGFYTPGTETTRPLTTSEQQILDELLVSLEETTPRLYERMQVGPAMPVRPGSIDIWTAVLPAAEFADDKQCNDEYNGECNDGYNADTTPAIRGGRGGVRTDTNPAPGFVSAQVGLSPSAGITTTDDSFGAPGATMQLDGANPQNETQVDTPDTTPGTLVQYNGEDRLPDVAVALIEAGVTTQSPQTVLEVLKAHRRGASANVAATEAGINYRTAKRIIDAYRKTTS